MEKQSFWTTSRIGSFVFFIVLSSFVVYSLIVLMPKVIYNFDHQEVTIKPTYTKSNEGVFMSFTYKNEYVQKEILYKQKISLAEYDQYIQNENLNIGYIKGYPQKVFFLDFEYPERGVFIDLFITILIGLAATYAFRNFLKGKYPDLV